jgi:hypothetical protein
MKTITEIREAILAISGQRLLSEAIGRQLTLTWDMGDPNKFAGDFQDSGVSLDDWNKKRGDVTVSGTEKNLYDWLINSYGTTKKDAHLEIMRGKKIKV